MLSRLFSLFKPRTQEFEPMWILVGLGNPGRQYHHNRHNIGFLAIDAIAEEFGLPAYRSKFNGDVTEGRIEGEKVVLVKPMTFMNNSGQCVGRLASFYKVTPNRIIVFHDELDLAPGKLRMKKGGGAAGHNGLRSLDSHLGSQDYHRVRMGIGHPGDKNRVTGYVLGDFSSAEREWLGDWLGPVAKHVPLLLKGAGEDYMTRVAADFPAPKER